MGFSSGTGAAENIWDKIERYIVPNCKPKVARIIVDEFENLDTDDFSEEDGGLYATAYPERCGIATAIEEGDDAE